MYTAILHTHKVVVGLFIFIYLVKTIFLLMPDKEEVLEKISRFTKIPEMVISFLMLGTGVFLLINASVINTLLIVKIGSVFASIPLAIIGFKKKIKPLAVLSLLLLVGAYGMAEIHKKRKAIIDPAQLSIQPTPEQIMDQARSIYASNCASCHGLDGKLGLSGAKNLQESTLSYEQKFEILKYGKNAMPGYGKQLSDEQIEALITHIEQNLQD